MRWGDIVAFLVVLAGGALTSWLVDRILPLDRVPDQTADFAKLSEKYRRWELQLMAIWLVVLLPATSVGTWRLLTRLAEARHARLGRFEIAFFPGGIEWGFPAVFLAAVAAALLLELGVRIYLGPQYAEYRRFELLQWGIGPWATWLSVIVLTAGPLLFSAVLMNWYAVFGAEQIRLHGFFALTERAYRYEDVRTIRTAPKWMALAGNEVDRREYVFCFGDGKGWDTDSAPGIVSRRDRLRLAEFVSKTSGVPIIELAVLTRKDLSCTQSRSAR